MSIVRVVMDERENKIRVIHRKIGERVYRLTDKRISSVITALVESGDSAPLTNWILSPVFPESQREKLLSSGDYYSEATLVPIQELPQETQPVIIRR